MSFRRRNLLKVIVLGDSGYVPLFDLRFVLFSFIVFVDLICDFVRVGKTSLMNQYPSLIDPYAQTYIRIFIPYKL